MSQLREFLKKPHSDVPAWSGVVVSAPTDLSDRLSVVVPAFDPNFMWEDCRWQARDAVSLPASGDACLVILDNNQEPWVIAWWPFTT